MLIRVPAVGDLGDVLPLCLCFCSQDLIFNTGPGPGSFAPAVHSQLEGSTQQGPSALGLHSALHGQGESRRCKVG